MKVLLLHGGPVATHEYFEAFDSYFLHEGIEYYYMPSITGYICTSAKLGTCANCSHRAMHDDQEAYFPGLIKFIKDVDRRRF